ncbi:MAG: nickel transporter, partial [Candidatus Limnocylindria bacterium]
MTRRQSLRAAAALALVMAALPAAATAHPLGNFSINHYARVTVSPERVEIDLVIDVAEIPTIAAAPSLDRDGDGSVSGGELRASEVRECLARAEALRVVVGGQAVSLTLSSAALELRPGAGALQTLRIACALRASIDVRIDSATTVEVADTGDADRLGWREIVVNGDGVVVADPTASTDVSHRLTA